MGSATLASAQRPHTTPSLASSTHTHAPAHFVSLSNTTTTTSYIKINSESVIEKRKRTELNRLLSTEVFQTNFIRDVYVKTRQNVLLESMKSTTVSSTWCTRIAIEFQSGTAVDGETSPVSVGSTDGARARAVGRVAAVNGRAALTFRYGRATKQLKCTTYTIENETFQNADER